jgi:hypothetical protein
MISRRLATIATVVCASSVSAFAPTQQHNSARIGNTELNIFGGLKGAFANDDALGKPQNAGLTGGPKVNENVSINGKPVNAVVGQKISQVAVSRLDKDEKFSRRLYRTCIVRKFSLPMLRCIFCIDAVTPDLVWVILQASARVKIPYNCKNGDCGTCTVKINGRNQKACQATVPAGKCAIVVNN